MEAKNKNPLPFENNGSGLLSGNLNACSMGIYICF
jgi:hypothetical protein